MLIHITVRGVEVESSRYLLLRDLPPDRISAMQQFRLAVMGGWDRASCRETVLAQYMAAFPGDTEQNFIDWFEALWRDGYRGPAMEAILGRSEEDQ